ncbi:hypothetical protein NDU88_005053 [Pleurodeles waltl]|uniref:Uncharacterized protein n=1 Tax=Pleurodeles waltl TaxID=8319 RepID=A0AAV7SKL5_PLEWA|nr:hypothetical protein NDU88_005053 [Pleurodeles waltl]
MGNLHLQERRMCDLRPGEGGAAVGGLVPEEVRCPIGVPWRVWLGRGQRAAAAGGAVAWKAEGLPPCLVIEAGCPGLRLDVVVVDLALLHADLKVYEKVTTAGTDIARLQSTSKKLEDQVRCLTAEHENGGNAWRIRKGGRREIISEL